jgi:hypothetical protein
MGMGSNNGQIYHPDPIARMVLNNQQLFTKGTGRIQPQAKQSPINDLLAKAMAAQPNAPTLAQLFPNLNMPSMYQSPMNNYSGILGNPMAGQYGAGRFLGGNSMSSGMTSNAMNTM